VGMTAPQTVLEWTTATATGAGARRELTKIDRRLLLKFLPPTTRPYRSNRLSHNQMKLMALRDSW